MIKLSLLLVVLLSGCASLQNAGTASYSVKPIVIGNQTICCEVSVQNGKEIANLEAHVSKTGDNYTVDLKEQGVVAFQGQNIAAGAAVNAAENAAKVATAAVLAPLAPALAPALMAPGIGAAAVGGAAVLGVQKLNTPVAPVK